VTLRSAGVLLVPAVLLGFGAPAPSSGRRPADLRRRTEGRLALLASRLKGGSGYLIRDVGTGETFEKDADTVFPAASTIKLPILLDLLKRGEEGTIDLALPLPIDPKARVEGGGVLEAWSEPYPPLSADHLAVLMMDFSDNYATNLLIDRIGIEGIQRRLLEWGMTRTLLRRHMMDFEAARAGRDNVTTPREMATLVERLYRGRILGAAATARALAIMTRNRKTPIKRGLPENVAAADKEGELDGVRCDSGIVFAGSGAFVLSVMTARLQEDAAGEAFIGDVTRAAFDYFRVPSSSSPASASGCEEDDRADPTSPGLR